MTSNNTGIIVEVVTAGPQGQSAAWLQGAGAPSSGTGANGDFYLNTSNGDIYGPKTAGAWASSVFNIAQGQQGPQGATGATGATGAAGADGKTVLNGTGAPSSGLGAIGDFYIDTAAARLYGPKLIGGWGGGISLIGPAGATGAQGPQGNVGPTGPMGPSGVVAATAPLSYDAGTQTVAISAATTSAAGSMSAADKTKLDGIAAGAEVNVNADWNAGSGDAQILNKPTLGTAAAQNVGTSAGNVVQLDASGNLPAVNGSQLTGIVTTTNLSYDTATRVIASSTGTDATLPLFDASGAGLTPASGGGTSKFLRADGTWATAGSPPAGSTGQIQYNASGAFAGDADLTWDASGNILTAKGDVRLDDGGSFTTTVQCVTPTANRTISFPDATGTVALVAGSSGAILYNNAGAIGGTTATFDSTNGTRYVLPFGYGTGAGGTVTQATNKSTGVTLNTRCGQITLNNAALASDTTVSFTLTNSSIAAGDVLILNHISGGTAGSYLLNAQSAAGTASINVRNITAGSLSEAIVIAFAVIKATTA